MPWRIARLNARYLFHWPISMAGGVLTGARAGLFLPSLQAGDVVWREYV